jgi:hypothetical protein
MIPRSEFEKAAKRYAWAVLVAGISAFAFLWPTTTIRHWVGRFELTVVLDSAVPIESVSYRLASNIEDAHPTATERPVNAFQTASDFDGTAFKVNIMSWGSTAVEDERDISYGYQKVLWLKVTVEDGTAITKHIQIPDHPRGSRSITVTIP